MENVAKSIYEGTHTIRSFLVGKGLHNLKERAKTEGFEGSDMITFLVVTTF
jgi:hypothetical protein